jgi:hypothetical protein
LSKIVFDGDPMPNGGTFSLAQEFSSDHTGRVAFDSGNFVYIETDSGALQLVARTNTVAPGATGTFQSFVDLNFKNGQLSFRAATSSPILNGIWRSDVNSTTLAFIDDQVIPGGYSIINTSNSAHPATAVNGSLMTARINPGNLDAILKQTGSSSPELIIREGQAAPGLPGTTISILNDVASNRYGQSTVSMSLSGGAFTRGIFRDLGSGLQLAASNVNTNGPAGSANYLTCLLSRIRG